MIIKFKGVPGSGDLELGFQEKGNLLKVAGAERDSLTGYPDFYKEEKVGKLVEVLSEERGVLIGRGTIYCCCTALREIKRTTWSGAEEQWEIDPVTFLELLLL